MNNIKIFIKKLKRFANLNDLSHLTKHDMKIINDPTNYAKEKQENYFQIKFMRNGMLENIFRALNNLINKLEFDVIHPYNKFRLIWDIFISFVIIFFLFFAPLNFAFRLYHENNYLKQILLPTILLTDMIIEMNTLYFRYGIEVRDRKNIFHNYLSTNFLLDLLCLIAIFPLNFELLFLLKIFSLDKISEKMMNRFQIIHKNKGIKDLIYLFFMIILITHFLACCWYAIGMMKDDENSWIKTHNLEYSHWLIQYMHSFYWSIITLMTVGYGDITPQNNLETCFCLFTILFGCMIFPYSINYLGYIIQDIKKDKNKFK